MVEQTVTPPDIETRIQQKITEMRSRYEGRDLDRNELVARCSTLNFGKGMKKVIFFYIGDCSRMYQQFRVESFRRVPYSYTVFSRDPRTGLFDTPQRSPVMYEQGVLYFEVGPGTTMLVTSREIVKYKLEGGNPSCPRDLDYIRKLKEKERSIRTEFWKALDATEKNLDQNRLPRAELLDALLERGVAHGSLVIDMLFDDRYLIEKLGSFCGDAAVRTQIPFLIDDPTMVTYPEKVHRGILRLSQLDLEGRLDRTEIERFKQAAGYLTMTDITGLELYDNDRILKEVVKRRSGNPVQDLHDIAVEELRMRESRRERCLRYVNVRHAVESLFGKGSEYDLARELVDLASFSVTYNEHQRMLRTRLFKTLRTIALTAHLDPHTTSVEELRTALEVQNGLCQVS